MSTMIGKKAVVSIKRSDAWKKAGVMIKLKDVDSQADFIEVRIGFAEFARAMTGYETVDCEFDLVTDDVGKVIETKNVLVFVSHSENLFVKSVTDDLLKPHECDGWQGNVDDLRNIGRKKLARAEKAGRYQEVTFTRLVYLSEQTEEQVL